MTDPRITKHSEHLPRQRSNGRGITIVEISKFQGALNRVRLALNKLDEAAQAARMGEACCETIAEMYSRTEDLDGIATARLHEQTEDTGS